MASGRAVPSDLFPLVLGFLRENHFDGAARAFKKAAGVTEQDPNAASLLDIFSYWLKSPIAKKQQAFANGSPAKKTKKELLSRYESSSENEIPPVKKQAAKSVTVHPVPIKATPGSSESSSADTSDSTDSEQEGKKPAKKGIVLQSTIQKTKPQKTSKSSSSDSSSSEDETPKHQPPKSGGAPKVIKLASVSAKPTNVMSKTTKGKAESSSSGGEMSSCEDSSSEENQPVKGKLKKLPHCKNNTAQPLPVKTKHVKKSNSETSCDSSEHEKLASKPKRGEYSAVPPPLATESRKGKAHLIKKIFKKKGKNNEEKEQVCTRRPSTQESVIKKAFALKSLPVSIQKGNNSLGSDSESSSEEDKKVLIKCSAKAVSANGAAKSVPSKKVSSSSDTSDFDSSDSIPEKFAVRKGINKMKKPLGVLAKKVESSAEDKKVHKIKETKAVKTTPKSSTPVSKPKTSESSSSSSEEQTQPSQKAANKLPVGSSSIISKQAPAEIRTSSESSTSEQFKIPDKREKKRGQNNCKIAKKVLKTSANFVDKTFASKTPTSEVLSSANSGNSDEEATKEGLSKKKRKRKGEQELETPDIKKMKVRSPHTFPKSKRQSSPFRRIRTEEIEIDVRVANNSFDAKKGAIDDWGKKANDVLKFTKGKSFRHEKTKKKRGSYCGGTISTQINSIKFESD